MRHRVAGRKLGRKTAHRMMMFRNMVTSLLDKEHIRTTLPKAKEVRPLAERMITLGKRETLHARRRALAFIKDPDVVKKLFDTLAPRFADRNGGYTRIIRLGFRDGDGAPMALLELVGSEYQAPKEEKKGKLSRKERKARAAAETAKEEAPKPKAKAKTKKAAKAKKETKDEKTSKTKRKKKAEAEE